RAGTRDGAAGEVRVYQTAGPRPDLFLRVDRGQRLDSDRDHRQPGAGAPAPARLGTAAQAVERAAARPRPQGAPDPDGKVGDGRADVTRLSPEQLSASRVGAGAHRVVAGAGTGKTAVIADRFRLLVAAGVPASSILVMTFSERPAAEVRDRIRSRLASDEGLLAVGP